MSRINKAGEWFAQPVEKREKRKYGIRWYTEPLAMQMGEFKKFDAGIKRRYPIQYFFREKVASFFRYRAFALKRDIYELKCRFIHRYNVIKLDIPPTWTDTCTLVPAVLAKLIIDFVEKETPWEVHNWSFNTDGAQAEADIRDAYDFFKNREPATQAEIEALTHKLYGRREGEDIFDCFNRERTEEELKEQTRLDKIEADLREETTRVLTNIVKWRDFLWT
jgi:hypothetical protein